MQRIPDPRLRVVIRLLSSIPPSAIDDVEAQLRGTEGDAEIVSSTIAESDTLKLASIIVLDELTRHLDRAAHSWGLPPAERARRLRELRNCLEAPCLALLAKDQLLSSADPRRREAYERLVAPIAPYLQDLFA